jgi:hemerythrin
MPLTWNDTLATGVRQIDLQHQELIDIINELEAAHTAGRPSEALGEVLPRLVVYALFHFSTEDALMSDVTAAHAEVHRREHHDFSQRVAAIQALPPEEIDMPELLAFLRHWLLEHIMKTDQDLARQLLAKAA